MRSSSETSLHSTAMILQNDLDDNSWALEFSPQAEV